VQRELAQPESILNAAWLQLCQVAAFTHSVTLLKSFLLFVFIVPLHEYFQSLNVSAELTSSWWSVIVARYSEPHRAYHSLQHILSLWQVR
jgi:hypothetical protein